MPTTPLPFSTDAAQNAVIYEPNGPERDCRGAAVVEKLRATGWTVFVFSPNPDALRGSINSYFVRKHMPIDAKDAREVVEAKTVHDRIAVVLDGLVVGGRNPAVSRLLADPGIFVASRTACKVVRVDHRYSLVWTSGNGWRRRGVSKGFAVLEPSVSPPPPPTGWVSWLWGGGDQRMGEPNHQTSEGACHGEINEGT